jgi:MoaA/NifB/PqqE/SkfB family radical SAM enzyme
MALSDWFSLGQSPIRQKIQQGTALSGCQRCYKTESQSIVSNRNRSNLKSSIYAGNFFRNSLLQSPSWPRLCKSNLPDKKPAFLHVSLSNLCNLGCKMCSPKFSSHLTSTLKKINLISPDTPNLLDWTQDASRWQQFCDLVVNNPDLFCLHFMGGEPLLHKKFHELIDLCIEKKSTNFHLTFVTNGTVYNKELITKLKHFKSIAIEISIENFHPTNDYIRQGGNMQTIKKNILNFIKNRNDRFDVVLRTVPQALSVMHYDTILDFAFEHEITIDMNNLSDPAYLKISILPREIKQKVAQKFTSKYLNNNAVEHDVSSRAFLLRNQTEFNIQLQDHVKNIIKLLQEPEPENIDAIRQQFVNYNKIFDQSSTRFIELYPDLELFYHEYSQN